MSYSIPEGAIAKYYCIGSYASTWKFWGDTSIQSIISIKCESRQNWTKRCGHSQNVRSPLNIDTDFLETYLNAIKPMTLGAV